MYTYCVVDVIVGSLILGRGRTMRENREDDEPEGVIGTGADAVAVAAPSTDLLSVSMGGAPDTSS